MAKFVGGWWDDAAGSFFLGQNEIDRSNASDAKLKQLNDAALERGAITPEEHQITVAHIEDHTIEQILANPETSIAAGFTSGAAEGLRNDFAAAGAVVGGIATAIPWKAYAVAGVAILFFLAYSGALPSRRR